MKLKILSLFTGIGAFEKALKNIGIECEIVGFSEIDKYAIKSYCAINNEDEKKNLGDITKIDISKIDTDVDIITHGSPCQDFSVAGKQAGAEKGSGTRSSLMWYTVDIVQQIKPKYVIWENVKNILSKKHKHNFDNYIEMMNQLGYNNYYQILNAKDYGIPQNRERVYTISIRKDIDIKQFKFPEKEELRIRLKDILEADVDEKYYLKNEQIKDFIKNNNGNCNPSGRGINGKVHQGNISPTITTNKGEGPKIDMLGLLDIKGNECVRRVYSQNGISPTLTNMQGGNRQPKVLEDPYIVASRGRNPEDPSSRIAGEHLEQRLEANTSGTTNCISTVQKDNYVVENNIKIRKLTPLECWRLMGFSDEDFRKAAKENSNSQLYKQAGNSIVVKVLEKIFKNLFIGEMKMEENQKKTTHHVVAPVEKVKELILENHKGYMKLKLKDKVTIVKYFAYFENDTQLLEFLEYMEEDEKETEDIENHIPRID